MMKRIFLLHHAMLVSAPAAAFLMVLLICQQTTTANGAFLTDNSKTRSRQPSSFATSSRLYSSFSLSNDEIRRYSRHLVLSDVGMKGQQALKDSRVLVVGAGGLGSPCLLYLAAAGVGGIGIVDGDTVDESNLQRQIIHGVDTVGISKCESARDRIRNINPNVNVRLFEEEFTAQTAERIVSGGFAKDEPWDLVIDGSDNFPTKYCINDACAMFSLPWVYSAILAFEGQLSVFTPNVDYRDLLPTPPPPGDVPSCAEGGVLGVLPGTMGCLQATEAIKLILGRPETDLLVGRVLVFDAMKMKFSEIGLSRDENREPITELIDYQGFCGGPQQQQLSAPATTAANGRTMDEAESAEPVADDSPSFHCIEPKECLNRLREGWSPFVLDVRLQTENDIVQLPFTDRVKPHRSVRVTDVPADGDVLVYCKAGVRGKKACNQLLREGVDANRLYNLEGGIMGWQKDVDQSMPRY